MQPLHFKKEINFEVGQTYSVCLRGARKYDTNLEYDLYLYSGETSIPTLANIVSQHQFRFIDIPIKYLEDNYDLSARTHEGLLSAMRNVYIDFVEPEIVTILRFKVQ